MRRGVDPDSIPRFEIPEQVYTKGGQGKMSKRVEQMTGLEAIDTLVDALEILSMLEFGEESDDDK